jgi:hypothetical protein
MMTTMILVKSTEEQPAATLRAFLLHCRESKGQQTATRDTEIPETQHVLPLAKVLFAFSDQRLACIQRLL